MLTYIFFVHTLQREGGREGGREKEGERERMREKEERQERRQRETKKGTAVVTLLSLHYVAWAGCPCLFSVSKDGHISDNLLCYLWISCATPAQL